MLYAGTHTALSSLRKGQHLKFGYYYLLGWMALNLCNTMLYEGRKLVYNRWTWKNIYQLNVIQNDYL